MNMKISVIVPTYMRTEYLRKCLDSLFSQTRLPDEIIIVTRSEDIYSFEVVKKIEEQNRFDIKIKNVVTSRPGIVHAENKGLENVSGDIICFIDDDATALYDWIERIEKHFADPNIGGVGGPCIPYIDGKPKIKTSKIIGKVLWFGLVIGNHEMITDKILNVDHLRGCNMAFRKKAFNSLNENLKVGGGDRWELDACLSIKEKGYKILYDPSILVYHYIAPRIGEKRNWSYSNRYEAKYNNTYVLLNHFSPFQKIMFLVYSFIEQFLAIILAIIKYRKVTMMKFIIPSLCGILDGLLFYLKKRGGT